MIWHLIKKIKPYKTVYFNDFNATMAMPLDAIQVMKSCTEALNQAGINYHLSWGTALGLYRDGKLIGHDTDIDCDIMNPDINQIDQALKQAGMVIGKKIYYGKKVQQAIYVSSGGVVFDVLCWYRRGQFCFNRCEEDYILRISRNYFIGHDTVVYDGVNYNVPKPIEKYLELLYGSTWKIPQSAKGDWKEGCPIVSKKLSPLKKIYSKLLPYYYKYLKKNG
jgi:hypothetical protein